MALEGRRYFSLILLCSFHWHKYMVCNGFSCGQQKLSLVCAEKHLTSFPSSTCFAKNRSDVECINLSRNRITGSITSSMFTKFTSLKTLVLSKNGITTIEEGALDQLTSLRELDLSENAITHITRSMFRKLKRLEKISLSENGIMTIQPGSFDGLNSLLLLELDGNKLDEIPRYNKMVKSAVTTLNLANNPISNLNESTMEHYPDLWSLYLQKTEIKNLPPRIFIHNTKLEYLYLTDTPLKHIDELALEGIKLNTLFLKGTQIHKLPGKGMEYLSELNIVDTKNLWELPFKSFRWLEKATVEYHFHCCLLNKSLMSIDSNLAPFGNFTPIKPCTTPYPHTTSSTTMTTTQKTTTTEKITDIFHKHRPNYNTEYENISATFEPEKCVNIQKPSHQTDFTKQGKRNFTCIPLPDSFNPCEDLLGTTALRVCTWFVLVFAIVGNALQLVVLLTSKRNTTMYQVLMCNLSVANLFMGIYLAMLAIIDAKSYGEYQNYALAWQHGPGCNIAGFLSILSTELAAFILTVITMERYFTIVHPLKLHMHLSVKQVYVLIFIGWTIALTLATLPLIGVSSYERVAICLPFEVRSDGSKAYVTFLLLTNGFAFIVVLFCYARMFLSLGGSTCSSATRIESRVARKMALLVLSNFSCWFPVAFFSLIAMYGNPVIDVKASKFLLVFIYPINSFTNPYLYALGTKHFQLDFLDLLKSFNFCENTIDKLRGRILYQLASLPHMSNSRGRTGSRTSVNSSMYRCPSPHSNLNSPLPRETTEPKPNSFFGGFLSIPMITVNKDDTSRSNSCISNDNSSEQLIHTEESAKDTHVQEEVLRRYTAREAIIGETTKKIQDAKKKQGLANKNQQKSKKEGKLPVFMVTNC